MTHPLGHKSDDELQLDETQLERFNAYYSRFGRIGSSPLTLEEAEMVIQLMTMEQRWALMAAINQKG